MAKIKFVNGIVEDYTIVLSTRDKRHLGQLYGMEGINFHGALKTANEISFTIKKGALLDIPEENTLSDEALKLMKEHRLFLWKNLVDLKLIWVKELNEYYQISVSTDDALDTVRTVTGTSLCEAELSQTMLYGVEINTEIDIERDKYEVTTFYNKDNPNASLLHRVLEKAPHYKIKHVDESLCKIQRTFSIDGTSIYDFLSGECSEQFDCLFVFDTIDRSISVYDLLTVCNDCGEREDYIDECPKCGSTNLKYYGKDTTIYVDKNNLSESIHYEENVDGIKNCFKLEAGDDVITAAVRELNPNGTDYITYISDKQKADMPKELVELLESYDELYNLHKERYEELLLDKYECVDELLKLEHSMMPTIEHAEVTAQTEADKLTEINLSPIALPSLTTSTSLQTVNSALKNYAKVYIKTGYVKLDVIDGAEFVYGGYDEETGLNYGSWYGKFKVTNYSDEEDIVETDYLNIEVTDNYEEFVEQKILKKLKSYEDEEEGSVFDVLAIEELEDFKDALTKYSMSRLVSFRDAIEGALDVLRELGQSSPKTDVTEVDLYDTLYLPYYEKLKACDEAISALQVQIDDINLQLENVQSEMNSIQKKLDFEKHLGDYYPIFCAYRREDKYSNSNYVSDGLTNKEVIDKAKEFIEVARKELIKSSNGEKIITAPLYNLLVMKEFQPLVDNFELGNWIRVKVDGELYRLRLIDYTINFDDLQKIDVEFSTITKINDVTSDIQSILSSAQSMATSYGYISKQAEKGQAANDTINSVIQDGLNSGLVQIKNNPEAEFLITKNGLLGRSKDDITGEYSPRQLKIINNMIALTEDNWKTTSQVIGEHQYTFYNTETGKFEKATGYGMTAQFCQTPYIYGGQIVGSEIYSTNYSPTECTGSYLKLDDGTFSFAGGRLRFDGKSLLISSPDVPTSEVIQEINESYLKETTVYAPGLWVNSAHIDGKLTASQINTEGLIAENISGTTITGKTISGGNLLIGNKTGTYAEITSNGKLTCVDGNFKGKITSSSFTVEGTIVKTASDYTEEDLDIIQGAIMGTVEYTPELIEKYDIDGNGVLHATDYVRIKNLLNGTTESYSINTTVKIDPMNKGNIIETEGVAIRSNGIYSKTATIEDLYIRSPLKVPADDSAGYHSGLRENISIGDKTLSVINGIIVSYQ